MSDDTKPGGDVAAGHRTPPRSRVGGRPRVFRDEDFFRATTRVLGRAGYEGLTLDAIAREFGGSTMAISRRFGSRRGLIRAYLEWSLGAVRERFARAREQPGSPLEALRARVRIPAQERIEEIGDPLDAERSANLRTFWSAVRSDPEFRSLANQSVRDSERAVAELLELAAAAGEIADCDAREIGRVLIAAWTGTTALWAGDGPEGTLPERLETVFDAIIAPYRTAPRHSR
ncbi:MAG TPA: TetR/AcrR family transcriptional regulator [Thermomicrobiales bacterium]|jgi:AcrR family transcriptional regulator